MFAGSVWFLKSNQLTREPIKLSKGHKHHNKGEILKFNISVNSKLQRYLSRWLSQAKANF